MQPNLPKSSIVPKLIFIAVVVSLEIAQIILIINSNQKIQDLTSQIKQANSKVSAETTPKDTFFSSQSATVKGKILSLNDRIISFQNEKGQTQDLELARVVLITQADGKVNFASSSASLQNIKLNTNAELNLILTEDKYLVTTITQ